jgi:AmmeMemoRadiSam system protein A
MSPLSEADKHSLLALAREAIERAVREDQPPGAIPSQGVFSRRGRIFVTLRCHGRLRGCIGTVEPPETLGHGIIRSAVSAALEDPRFRALDAGELPDLQIEISLLSPPERIEPDEFEIGRDGLLICRGESRGVLLPQVATEHGLTRATFLEETCRKAGLPASAWKEAGTEIYAFRCEVIAEEERGGGNP